MRGTRRCGKERAEAGFSVLWPTYEDGVSGVPRSPLCVRAQFVRQERVRWLCVDFLAHSSQLTACCVAIQRTLLVHRWRQGVAPQLRIGLDSGSAQQHESGYRGKGVHVAARHRGTCRGRRDPGKRGNSLTPRRTSHALPSSWIPLSALQLFWPADRLLTRQGNTSSGGTVVGHSNSISGPYSAVTGGDANSASGAASSVVGGSRNRALGDYSTVLGGSNNEMQSRLGMQFEGFEQGLAILSNVLREIAEIQDTITNNMK